MSEMSAGTEVRAPFARDRRPLLLRLLGSRWVDGRSARMWWGELSWGLSPIGISVGAYETAHLNIALGLFQVFIRLPFLDCFADRGVNDGWRYGFSIHGGRDNMNDVHLSWGGATKVLNFPWQAHYRLRHEFLALHGHYLPADQKAVSWREGGVQPWSQTLPYSYLWDDGTVQRVDATVSVERSKPGWRWFGNGPLSRGLQRWQTARRPWTYTLDISFSGEVGERSGSWKGGTIGCGWEMRAGETPAAALRRMQRERRFR